MSDSVRIGGYGQYSSGNYGAHALRVDVGGLRLWFSYQTCVAFQVDGHTRRVHKNQWGTTTGKHLNWIDGGGPAVKARLAAEDFDRQLAEAVGSTGVSVA